MADEGHVIRRGEEGYDDYNSYEIGTCPECLEPLSWAATEDESWWNFGPEDGVLECPICHARIYLERVCSSSGRHRVRVLLQRASRRRVVP
jgi:uncharacterized protein YbaR (Trm112 family)